MATQNAETPVQHNSVGTITEVVGEAYVIHADGSREAATKGAPVLQGDTVETGGNGAINILFADNSSFAVSENARMGIDEFTFDSAEQTGTSFFSMVQGVFVYTSGLIGKSDPGDVNIDTPVGSIGIRGTVIAGDIKPEGQESSITILDGAIALTNSSGTHEINSQFDTIALKSYNDMPAFAGKIDAAGFNKAYGSLSNVANDTVTKFSAGDGARANRPDSSDGGKDAAGAEANGENTPEGEGKPEGPAKEGVDPAAREATLQEAVNDPSLKEAAMDATVKEGMVREALQDQALREQMAKEKMLDGEMARQTENLMDPATMREPGMKDPMRGDAHDPFRGDGDPMMADHTVRGMDGAYSTYNGPAPQPGPAPTGTNTGDGTTTTTTTTTSTNYVPPIEFFFHPDYFNTQVAPGGRGVPEYAENNLDIGHIASPLGLTFTNFAIVNAGNVINTYNGVNGTTTIGEVLEINSNGKLLIADQDSYSAFSHIANPNGFDVTIKATDSLGREHYITKHIDIRDFQPGVTPDFSDGTMSGSAGADLLVSTNTTDTYGTPQIISNVGTGDMVIGSDGAQAISIVDRDFKYIYGGDYTNDASNPNYMDKLILAEDNLHLNFGLFNEVRVQGIEKISFGASIDNAKITLGIKDIFDITDGGGELRIHAESTASGSEVNLMMQGMTRTFESADIVKYSGTFNGHNVTLVVDGTGSSNISIHEVSSSGTSTLNI